MRADEFRRADSGALFAGVVGHQRPNSPKPARHQRDRRGCRRFRSDSASPPGRARRRAPSWSDIAAIRSASSRYGRRCECRLPGRFSRDRVQHGQRVRLQLGATRVEQVGAREPDHDALSVRADGDVGRCTAPATIASILFLRRATWGTSGPDQVVEQRAPAADCRQPGQVASLAASRRRRGVRPCALAGPSRRTATAVSAAPRGVPPPRLPRRRRRPPRRAFRSRRAGASSR